MPKKLNTRERSLCRSYVTERVRLEKVHFDSRYGCGFVCREVAPGFGQAPGWEGVAAPQSAPTSQSDCGIISVQTRAVTEPETAELPRLGATTTAVRPFQPLTRVVKGRRAARRETRGISDSNGLKSKHSRGFTAPKSTDYVAVRCYRSKPLHLPNFLGHAPYMKTCQVANRVSVAIRLSSVAIRSARWPGPDKSPVFRVQRSSALQHDRALTLSCPCGTVAAAGGRARPTSCASDSQRTGGSLIDNPPVKPQ